MPNPSNELLNRLGLSNIKPLPKLTPEQEGLKNKLIEQWRKEHPIANKVFEYTPGFLQGLLGINTPGFDYGTKNNPYNDRNDAALVGNLVGAGLPFAELLGDAKVFHGTQKLFDYFDPKKANVSDTLGWMTHFAENPSYAERYAGGMTGGPLVSFDPELGEVTKSELDPYLKYGMRSDAPLAAPRTIAAKIHNKNTLDLINPNWDDLSQAVAALNPEDRAGLVESFKSNKRYPSYEKPEEGIIQQLMESFRRSPKEFKRSPFDAIRYMDVNEPSWAIDPTQVKITTPGGIPLTKVNDIQVIRK